jgi:hypothetical protein|tara:strand:- start:223 stop:345 length:123 start_codon:yes stop_codon:yes gene_type:complete
MAKNEESASKSSTKKSSKRPTPPKGSAEHKAMVLRGEIKE